jgi:flagellar biosynthesis protein FliR
VPLTSPAILWLLEQSLPFLLTAGRFAGLFLFAPLLSSAMIPPRIKGLLVLTLAAALYPALGPSVDASMMRGVATDVFALPLLLVQEALIGYTIGAIAAIPLLSVEMSGVIASQQMGLGIANIYNPESDVDANVLGQMLYTIAIAGFIAAAGVDRLFICVADTFNTIPIGGYALAAAPLDLFLSTLTAGFELAMRVTTPVAGAVTLMTIALGAVTKTMPQINVMSVGFTFKILIGMGALVAGIYAIGTATSEVTADTLLRIEDRMLHSPPVLNSPEEGSPNG